MKLKINILIFSMVLLLSGCSNSGDKDTPLNKLITQLDDTKFIKNFNTSEWTKNVTENFNKIKKLPDINTNPKINEVNKILSDNKKVIDDIMNYFNKLEIDTSIATSENTKLFNDISENLHVFSKNIETTKRLLMLPSNKLTDDNIKFISEITGYTTDGVKKLLTTISDAIKYFSLSFEMNKKLFNASMNWYTKDQSDKLLKALQILTPLNFNQAFRGKSPWINTFGEVWLQAEVYGTAYKIIRCELFGDEETNNLISSWGPEEKSLWEKHKVNSLSKIVETFNENPLIGNTINFITDDFIKAIAGDCEEIDPKILQKLVDDGKLNPAQANIVRDLGMKYFKTKGYDKFFDLLKQNIKDAKESIKEEGKNNFIKNFSVNSAWY